MVETMYSRSQTCVHSTPPLSLQPPGAKPVVKCLLQQEEKLEVNENHFTVPVSLQECVGDVLTCQCVVVSVPFS